MSRLQSVWSLPPLHLPVSSPVRRVCDFSQCSYYLYLLTVSFLSFVVRAVMLVHSELCLCRWRNTWQLDVSFLIQRMFFVLPYCSTIFGYLNADLDQQSSWLVWHIWNHFLQWLKCWRKLIFTSALAFKICVLSLKLLTFEKEMQERSKESDKKENDKILSTISIIYYLFSYSLDCIKDFLKLCFTGNRNGHIEQLHVVCISMNY